MAKRKKSNFMPDMKIAKPQEQRVNGLTNSSYNNPDEVTWNLYVHGDMRTMDSTELTKMLCRRGGKRIEYCRSECKSKCRAYIMLEIRLKQEAMQKC